MATEVWHGPGGTSSHPRSGAFAVASNWSDGAVPTQSVNAILTAGRYTVTLTNVAQVASLNIGAGATFKLDQQGDNSVNIILHNDSFNAGKLVLAGASLGIDSGGSLTNVGEIYGALGSDLPTIDGGTVVNEGLIAGSSGDGQAYLMLISAVQNATDGVIDTRGASQVIFSGAVDNQGLISAVDGGLINFTAGSTLGHTQNLGGGVLTGGRWSAIGDRSTLVLYNSDIETLTGGAAVTLSGAGSYLGGQDGSGATAIEASLVHIAAGSELHILGGRDYATTQDLQVGGLVELGGGTLTAAGLTVSDEAGAELRGYGLVAADIDISGVLRAANNKAGVSLELTGDNRIAGTVAGKGTLEFSGGHDMLEAGAKVFVNDIVVGGQDTVLTLGQDLVYDGKLTSEASGAVQLGGHTLRLSGKVTLDSGDIGKGQLQLEGAQVTSTGATVVQASVRNDGVVTVKNGEHDQVGAVNGVGEYHVLNAARLDFAAAVGAGQTVFMDGASATLGIGTGTGFRGAVSGFAAGDTLNFETVDAAGASYSWKADGAGGGTLTLVNGLEKATLHLEGAYQKSMFHLSAAEDGLNVTYGDTAASHADAHWDAHGGLAI